MGPSTIPVEMQKPVESSGSVLIRSSSHNAKQKTIVKSSHENSEATLPPVLQNKYDSSVSLKNLNVMVAANSAQTTMMD